MENMHYIIICSILIFSRVFSRFLAGGLTPCQMSQQNSTGLPFGNSHLIRCKEDGRYEAVQCSGSTGFCWCVDQNGSKLEGTETRGILKCPALGKFVTLFLILSF